MKRIYIDSNIWNDLLCEQINIRNIFPENEFDIYINRHLELEIEQTPSHLEELNTFIAQSLENWNVKSNIDCGFPDGSVSPEHQRNRFFGATPPSIHTIEFKEKIRERYPQKDKKRKNNILFPNEADLSLAGLSKLYHVITNDSKAGPLTYAKELGGKVIILRELEGETAKERLHKAKEIIL